jgi:hypothetical protein
MKYALLLNFWQENPTACVVTLPPFVAPGETGYPSRS